MNAKLTLAALAATSLIALPALANDNSTAKGQVDINATISPMISITIDQDTIDLSPSGIDGDVVQSTSFCVATNNAGQYKMAISDDTNGATDFALFNSEKGENLSYSVGVIDGAAATDPTDVTKGVDTVMTGGNTLGNCDGGETTGTISYTLASDAYNSASIGEYTATSIVTVTAE
ncbi:hypothetical protein SIN8267_02058 [Sinobacterium norvegicum]|uniref:Uncharacterized protein n=1 Tax=Sinobacterium norvegicum TaxID=1641715 RepID=A0ABN8EJU3_9GAMM|nr:hypothetical protein [Sinobacterium norvegicum]CAH0991943.1 hypothetical protein SIN8267_02058 [Sinobacterium norvegicum]